MLPTSLYRYMWTTSRHWQVRICLLIGIIAPLSMVPLELQRRIVDDAIGKQEIWLLLVLGLIYLLVSLVQGGLKYVLNVTKGRVLEEVTRDLRKRILQRARKVGPLGSGSDIPAVDEGTTMSMIAAESEDVGGFASESLAVPLLQAGTILWVMGYLLWVQPLIAGLAILVYAPQAFLVPRIQHSINRLARKKTSVVRKLGHDAVADSNLAETGPVSLQLQARILIEQIFRLRMFIYRLKFFLTFLGNFLDALGPIIVLVLGGYLVARGQTDISTLVVFISGFQKLADPWDQLVNFYRSVSNARVTYGLVADALNGTTLTLRRHHAAAQA